MGHDGFISYSHAADEKLAPAVQAGLQRLARPWYKRSALGIFRDQTGLSADPQLWTSIERALDGSRYFIWMASPESAASPWVGRELEHWLATKTAGSLRILPVLTAGELLWDDARGAYDPVASTALPPALATAFAEEPRHVDLRWARDDPQLDLRHSRFRDAIADLAAPMHGVSKDELESQDVRRHRRTLRLAWSVAIGLAVLALAASASLVVAVRNGARATRERDRAEASLRRALSVGLANNADNTKANLGNPQLAYRLAALANRVATTPDAFGALLVLLDEVGAAPPQVLLHGHPADAPTPSLAVSGDGNVIASFETRGGLVLHRLSGRRAPGPPGRVLAVALDDTGNRIAYAPSSQEVRVWDADAKRDVLTRSHRGAPVVALSRDGRFVASVANDTVEVTEIATGATTRFARPAELAEIAGLALDDDGGRVAAIGPGPTAGAPGVSGWNTVWWEREAPDAPITADPTRNATGTDLHLQQLRFGSRETAPTLTQVVAKADANSYVRWNVTDGRAITTSAAKLAAVSADGTRGILTARGGTTNDVCLLVESDEASTQPTIGCSQQVTPVQRGMATVDISGSGAAPVLLGGSTATSSGGSDVFPVIAIAPAAGQVVDAFATAGTRALDVPLTPLDPCPVARCPRAAFAGPDDRAVVASTTNGRVAVFAADPTLHHGLVTETPGPADLPGTTTSVAGLSPDGRRVAFGRGPDGAVALLDVAAGKVVAARSTGGGAPEFIAVAADGDTVAAQLTDHVLLWDAARDRAATVPVRSPHAAGVAFSPDGRTLAVVGTRGSDAGSGTLELWDTTVNRPRRIARAPVDGANASDVQFTANGTQVVVRTDQGLERTDVASGRRAGVVARHAHLQPGTILLSNPDADLDLAVGPIDAAEPTVRVWDLRTERKYQDFNAIVRGFRLVASHDGTMLAGVDAGGCGTRLLDTATVQVITDNISLAATRCILTGASTAAGRSPGSVMTFTPNQRALIVVDAATGATSRVDLDLEGSLIPRACWLAGHDLSAAQRRQYLGDLASSVARACSRRSTSP